MDFSTLRYGGSALCALPAFFLTGDALKHLSSGHNAGQKAGNALEAVPLAVLAGGFGLAAWKAFPSQKNGKSGGSDGDTVNKTGEGESENKTMWQRAKDLVGLGGSGSDENLIDISFDNDKAAVQRTSSLSEDTDHDTDALSSGASTPRSESATPETNPFRQGMYK